jgi:putative hydrolase of the HAD superfamily
MRAVLLDLDDTLYPERSYFESGLAAVAAWVAAREGADDGAWRERLARDVAAHGRDGVLDRVEPPPGRTREQWRAALLHVYRTHAPRLVPFGDVEPFLARARSEGVKLGLVTDGKSRVQWRKLEALGLDRRLDAIVCSDDLDGRKPDAAPFLAAAALLDVPPEACTYVADDASKDFVAPHRLGMATIQVCRDLPFPLARTAPAADAEARCRVRSLAAAAEILFGGAP